MTRRRFPCPPVRTLGPRQVRSPVCLPLTSRRFSAHRSAYAATVVARGHTLPVPRTLFCLPQDTGRPLSFFLTRRFPIPARDSMPIHLRLAQRFNAMPF